MSSTKSKLWKSFEMNDLPEVDETNSSLKPAASQSSGAVAETASIHPISPTVTVPTQAPSPTPHHFHETVEAITISQPLLIAPLHEVVRIFDVELHREAEDLAVVALTPGV